MKIITNLLITLLLLSGWIILSSWGGTGHRKINQHAPASFPSQMNFLKSTWPDLLAYHASDADYRKDSDINEAPKHYLDLDNYTEFLLHGRILQTFDSITMIYGIEYVLGNGILPWATCTTFDSLKACFHRNNFTKAMLFASDLGHYVGDGHQPLHITAYYDGRTQSQHGIHSRYETNMVNDYSDFLTYEDDSAVYIPDIQGYIFNYIYYNYQFMDSILYADDYSQALAGNHNSTAYYNALWTKTGAFTIQLMKHASFSLASLIYTAWVDAGSPNGIDDFKIPQASLMQNNPNPFDTETVIPFNVAKNNALVSLKIYDAVGNLLITLLESRLTAGTHEIKWNSKAFHAGLYYCVLESGGRSESKKLIVIH
jgi:hypothetical protein